MSCHVSHGKGGCSGAGVFVQGDGPNGNGGEGGGRGEAEEEPVSNGGRIVY